MFLSLQRNNFLSMNNNICQFYKPKFHGLVSVCITVLQLIMNENVKF